MRVAYLTNQYPKVSHSFIRREIAALEQRGATVERFTLRAVDEPLLDPADVAEQARTMSLIDVGPARLVHAVRRFALRSPRRFAEATRLAVMLGLKSERGAIKHAGYLAAACVLAEELEARGVRHVHAHFGTNPAAVAMLCHVLSGASYSFTVHGPEEFDQTYSLGLPEKIEHAAFVAAVSSYGRTQLQRITVPSAWDKLIIVRCGLDASYIDAPPTAVPATTKLVSVARLSGQKGQLTLLDATAEALREGADIDLVLVGDGELRGAVEARIRELGISSRVTITGWASGDEVQRHLREARSFVLPSYAEGLPVVMMEALALGRPVISTYVAGIPELVQPRECGWLVPAGAVTELAQAMSACARMSPADLTRLGLEGRRRVLRDHDITKNVIALADRFEMAITR